MSKDTYRRIRQILQQEQAVRTPQCPEPETLWTWLEQEDAHPKALFLLEHIFVCAHCRAEHLSQLRIRALTGRADTAEPAQPSETCHIPARVRKWVEELLQGGFIAPSRPVQAALNRITRLTAAQVPETVRSSALVFDLRPASTLLRPTQPVLRWASRQAGLQYEVQLWKSLAAERSTAASKKLVWEGSSEVRLELPVPENVALEPGGCYLWQVTAWTESYEWYSPYAGFTIVSEQSLRQIEELEHKVGASPLARIGIYEAYGLYEEALQSAETLLNDDLNNSVAHAIKAKLQQRAG